MKLSTSAATFAALLFAGLSAHAGDFTYSPFTGDADSGVNLGLNYTTLADFNGDGTRVVNGVSFLNTGASAGAVPGGNYSLNISPATFNAFGNNVTGASGAMLTDFIYTGDGSGNASLVLSGLTVGQTYVTTWYNSAFGGVGGRNINITADDTNTSIFFDENYTNNGNGNVLRYTFTATAPTITYSFDADGNTDSFHHYAVSNAVANTALLSTPKISKAISPDGTPGFSPFTPSNTDLLQGHLSGVVSSGNFTQEGSGGIPILTNGIFVLNGGNVGLGGGDNSQLATVGNGDFIEFDLDTTVNALGYDISKISTFGGWNDAGRDHQLFKLSYSQVGSPDFTYLGSLDADGGASTTQSAIQADFDTALTGVDAIRLDFFGGQENGYAGLGEVDAIGAATVPEPASAGLLFVGAVGLLYRRRPGQIRS